MLFSSYEFILFFLPVVLAGFFLLNRWGMARASLGWLVISSLFFYGWWNPVYLILLVTSIIFNYGCGIWIWKTHQTPRLSKMFLIVGVSINLGLLGYYKYANFFANNLNIMAGNQLLDLGEIALPLAISFFTFQQIAYLVDTYQAKAHEYSFDQYALFVSFFPQLIAGPIVHHKEMMPQFRHHGSRSVRLNDVSVGIAIFCIGLFKKVVLADSISQYAVPVFDAAEMGATLTFFEAWGGALAYTFQLYFDFSGYSDMAIGLARMFGIRLPENFNSPYKAKSIAEFWRCWHMTLSRFLRDYCYIPLGGNQRGIPRRYLYLMITMLLGGLWHGAGWTFIIWGALHGGYLVVNHLWAAIRKKWVDIPESLQPVYGIFSWFITFLAVVIAWVFFRAESFDGAFVLLQGMVGMNGAVLDSHLSFLSPLFGSYVSFTGSGIGHFGDVWGILFLAVLFPIAFLLPNTRQLIGHDKQLAFIMATRRKTILWSVVLSVMFIIAMIRMTTVNQFLYFNF